MGCFHSLNYKNEEKYVILYLQNIYDITNHYNLLIQGRYNIKSQKLIVFYAMSVVKTNYKVNQKGLIYGISDIIYNCGCGCSCSCGCRCGCGCGCSCSDNHRKWMTIKYHRLRLYVKGEIPPKIWVSTATYKMFSDIYEEYIVLHAVQKDNSKLIKFVDAKIVNCTEPEL